MSRKLVAGRAVPATVRVYAIVFGVLLLAGWPVCTLGAEIDRIEVLEEESGIFVGVDREAIPDAGVVGGQRVKSTNLKLESRTSLVPARIGTMFGFRYKIVGRPLGEAVPLKFVTRFPAPGLKDPATSGAPQVTNEFTLPRTVGDIFYRGYGLDKPWELVPGTWTFEIWSGDTKFVDKTFTVYNPK